ncbi:MAG TPA: HD domain-containing phosphohydrolase [bacterium]|nr:HD domain-containing phosphohydrolase [bacterium]
MNDLLKEEAEELFDPQMKALLLIAERAESRDEGAGRHIERVQLFCKLLSLHLSTLPRYTRNITGNFVENIYGAAPLHDIGKAEIDDRILLKPGKLTPDEFEVVKTHTTIGWRTIEAARPKTSYNLLSTMGMSIARYHHEKWDGSGYPAMLVGEEIPLEARIMAIADVYDVLRSRRVYKEPYSHQKSADIIVAGKGTHFDPAMVDAFVGIQNTLDMVYAWIED